MIVIKAGVPDTNRPRIGYRSLLTAAAIATSTAETDFEGVNIIDPLTWNFWRPTALPATVEFTIDSAKADYIGIAAHNLGSLGCGIKIEYWVTDAYVELFDLAPTDDSTIIGLFNEITTTKWRITVTNADAAKPMPSIGVVYIGQELKIPQGIFQGHAPISLSKKTEILPNLSEGGQWLGRSVIREGFDTDISLTDLTSSFIRTHFKPFMDHAITTPFFWAWRPDYNEAGYVWTDGDIVPVNSGPKDLMSVSFSVMGTD